MKSSGIDIFLKSTLCTNVQDALTQLEQAGRKNFSEASNTQGLTLGSNFRNFIRLSYPNRMDPQLKMVSENLHWTPDICTLQDSKQAEMIQPSIIDIKRKSKALVKASSGSKNWTEEIEETAARKPR